MDNRVEIILAAKDITGKAFTNVQQKVSNLTNTITSFNGVIGGAAIGYAMMRFTGSVVNAGVSLDSLQKSFEAIAGSQAEAAKQMEFVNMTAKRLGLSLPTLEQAYKGILAASRGTALEGEAIQRVFTSVSEASAVLGLSADQTQGTLLALSQMISKGTVQAEELRGQLGERLPGAFQLAAQAMGVTTQELGKMLQKGEVLAEDLLPKLADVLTQKYGTAAKQAGESSRAAFENLRTAVLELERAIAESGLVDMLADAARYATIITNGLFPTGENAELAAAIAMGDDEKIMALAKKPHLYPINDTRPDTLHISKAAEKLPWMNLDKINMTDKEQRMMVSQDMVDETKKRLADLTKAGTDTADAWKNAFDGWASGFSATLNDMLWGAEMTFGNMGKAFAKMLTQMMIQVEIVDPMKKLFTGGGFDLKGLFGSLGGIFGTGTAAASVPWFSPAGVPHFDTGGVMGPDGLKKAFPAVLHEDEIVGTADQMKSMFGKKDTGTNIMIHAVDAKSFNDMVRRNPAGIISVIDQAISGNGSLRQTIGATL